MFKKYHEMGILGMNRRVGEFILPYNERKLYPLVDNKTETYFLCKEYGINQPEIYYFINTYGDLKQIDKHLEEHQTFVVKPCRGAKGNGILVVNSVDWNEGRLSTSKEDFTLSEFKHYVSDILSGMYSLSGQPDEVIIQEKLLIHPELAPYSYKGIPDVRVIVFKGYPAMAMVRLPTKRSRGRANLHQGAVGCGLNMKDGSVCGSIYQNRWIEAHPDTEADLTKLVIPHWKEILILASKCYDITKMGYLGVDLVLDETRGPLLLEMNARPGLSIQTANMTGLLPRLKAIQLQSAEAPIEEKVMFSLLNF